VRKGTGDRGQGTGDSRQGTVASGRWPAKGERGVTLVELMIAITLVSALAVGMLMALRSGITTMDRINVRLEQNRRIMGLQQIVSRQIGGAIPVAGCRLNGGPNSLQLVTTYSINEGARGFPHLVVFSVAPDPAGGQRLQEIEYPYTSPGACGVNTPGAASQTLILASRLQSVAFSYHEPQAPNAALAGNWVGAWAQPLLPSAVRIETVPLDGGASNLPALAVYASIHVTMLQMPYADDYQ